MCERCAMPVPPMPNSLYRGQVPSTLGKWYCQYRIVLSYIEWQAGKADRMAITSAAKYKHRRNQMGVLQDRVAIVTGGSAGLGEATAELFAAEGALVIIAGASDLGEKVAERLGITFIKADVSRSTEVDTLVDRVAQRFGRLDIMV